MASLPRIAVIDCYTVLGVTPDATLKDINSAYKKLALKYHPDKSGGDNVSENEFCKIQQAIEILRDPFRRRDHDAQLRYRSTWSEHAGNYHQNPAQSQDQTPFSQPDYQGWRPHPRRLWNIRHAHDRYMYSYGNSVHMDPMSQDSQEEKRRAEEGRRAAEELFKEAMHATWEEEDEEEEEGIASGQRDEDDEEGGEVDEDGEEAYYHEEEVSEEPEEMGCHSAANAFEAGSGYHDGLNDGSNVEEGEGHMTDEEHPDAGVEVVGEDEDYPQQDGGYPDDDEGYPDDDDEDLDQDGAHLSEDGEYPDEYDDEEGNDTTPESAGGDGPDAEQDLLLDYKDEPQSNSNPDNERFYDCESIEAEGADEAEDATGAYYSSKETLTSQSQSNCASNDTECYSDSGSSNAATHDTHNGNSDMKEHETPTTKIEHELSNNRLLDPFIPYFRAKLTDPTHRYTLEDVQIELKGIVMETFCGWLESCRFSFPDAKPDLPLPLSSAVQQDPTTICDHLGFWIKEFGVEECAVCQRWKPIFTLTCPRCMKRACVGCKFLS